MSGNHTNPSSLDRSSRGKNSSGKKLLFILHGSYSILKKILVGKADPVIAWLVGFLNEISGWPSEDISKEKYLSNQSDVASLVEGLDLNDPMMDVGKQHETNIMLRSLINGQLKLDEYSDVFWERDAAEIFAALELLSHFSIDFKSEFKDITMTNGLIDIMSKYWFEPKLAKFTEFSYSILVNLTTLSEMCDFICNHKSDICVQLLDQIQNQTVDRCTEGTMRMLDSVAKALCNLSRVDAFQRFLLDTTTMPILQFGTYMNKFITTKFSSEIYREYLAGTIKNCLFRKQHHKWLIEEADILSTLLIPLAGNEKFTEEENSKLPPDLQYLPEDKLREPCLKVRLRLLEGLLQLCQTREIREIIRENNVYLILRECHKWETESEADQILEDIINILIRTEDEIGVADYNQIHDDELARTLNIKP